MKKIYTVFLIIFLSSALLIYSCEKTDEASDSITESSDFISESNEDSTIVSSGESSLEAVALHKYTASMSLNTHDRILTVGELVTYKNTSGTTLDRLFFRLIPHGVNPLDVSITLCSNEYEFVKSGILELKLGEPLDDGSAVTINFDYTIKIAERDDEYGYRDGIFNCGNVLLYAVPIINGIWKNDAYDDGDENGDPYFTEAADFHIKLHFPSDYDVAATYGMVSREVTDGVTTQVYDSSCVRDFTFSVFKSLNYESYLSNGVKINLYYSDNDKNAMQYAVQTIDRSLLFFSQRFNPYPYPELTVMFVPIKYALGNEFSSFIYVAAGTPETVAAEVSGAASEIPFDWNDIGHPEVMAAADLMTEIIVHEIAHQWYYVITGNDQINEAWLDEGGATFAEELYFAEYGLLNEYIAFEYYEEMIEKFGDALDNSDGDSFYLKKIDGKTKLFEKNYGFLVYRKASVLYYELYILLGEDKFFEAQNEYFSRFGFKTVTEETFCAFWEEFAGEPLSHLYDFYLNKEN